MNIQLSLFPAAVVHLFPNQNVPTIPLFLACYMWPGCTKSDIFSVGVLAFNAACGKHPFINEDLPDVQEKLFSRDFLLCLLNC